VEDLLPSSRKPPAEKPAKPCKFCEIAAGREKSFTVFADEHAVAFLDYRPLLIGHVLLIPKTHYANLEEIPAEVLGGLAERIKPLSAAVARAMDAEGSFIALNNKVSQSVPHVHFHVVPRRHDDHLFSAKLIWRRVNYRSAAQREEVAAKIRAALG
jgi:histidine triad (HIT) family protein